MDTNFDLLSNELLCTPGLAPDTMSSGVTSYSSPSQFSGDLSPLFDPSDIGSSDTWDPLFANPLANFNTFDETDTGFGLSDLFKIADDGNNVNFNSFNQPLGDNIENLAMEVANLENLSNFANLSSLSTTNSFQPTVDVPSALSVLNESVYSPLSSSSSDSTPQLSFSSLSSPDMFTPISSSSSPTMKPDVLNLNTVNESLVKTEKLNTKKRSCSELEDKKDMSTENVNSSTRRKISCGGVSYHARKRAEPLPPVKIPDPNDTAALKRARNTEAARRSRARKMNLIDELEARVKALTERNRELEEEVARLKKQDTK